VTYAVVLAGTGYPFRPSESLNNTGKCTYQSVTGNRCTFSYIARPLNDNPDNNTPHATVTNNSLPIGERTNNTPIFIKSGGNAGTLLA